MKNKGFTLIEILAVVIILGVIAMITIPSVSKYINDSRKEAYIATARKYLEGSLFAIKKNKFDMSDKTSTYYISYRCISLEKGGNSPYGEWEDAYVVMGYNDECNDYEVYWTSLDSKGHGVELTLFNRLSVNSIVTSLKKVEVKNLPGKTGKIKILDINDNGKCSVIEK